MNLYQYFLDNRGSLLHKNLHYFPVYERHFAQFRNRPVTVFEISDSGGGSPQMWKRFFGPYARVVVITSKTEHQMVDEPQISVRVGQQGDERFLSGLVEEFGSPDIVIDDGTHQMTDVTATFRHLYGRVSTGGVYLVEDMHTAYWREFGGGFRTPVSFLERCKDMVDELNAEHTRGALPPTAITASTISMHFYNSVVVFERGTLTDTRSILTGSTPTSIQGPTG